MMANGSLPPSTNPKIIIKSYTFHMEAVWQLRGSSLPS